jgi:RNase H-fold protein (predicted Holliday junction resolvase)
MSAVAAIDPGHSKCGLVLSDPQRMQVVQAGVLPTSLALEQLRHWCREPGLAAVVLGKQDKLVSILPLAVSVAMVVMVFKYH